MSFFWCVFKYIQNWSFFHWNFGIRSLVWVNMLHCLISRVKVDFPTSIHWQCRNEVENRNLRIRYAMWRQTMWRENVASGANVVAIRNVASNNVASDTNMAAEGNVASNNVASKCGVRHPLNQTIFQEICLQKRYSVAGTKVIHYMPVPSQNPKFPTPKSKFQNPGGVGGSDIKNEY